MRSYFTAGLGPEGPDKLETLKYPTDEVQKQNWLTYMSGKRRHDGKQPTLLCHVGAQHRQ